MKRLLAILAVAAIATGCAEVRHNAGGTVESDHNVLTGGPVTGTRISDLPQAVLNTLRQRAPSAEVADIDRETWSGNRVVYQIQFAEPGRNPVMYIDEQGQVVTRRSNLDR